MTQEQKESIDRTFVQFMQSDLGLRTGVSRIVYIVQINLALEHSRLSNDVKLEREGSLHYRIHRGRPNAKQVSLWMIFHLNVCKLI